MDSTHTQMWVQLRCASCTSDRLNVVHIVQVNYCAMDTLISWVEPPEWSKQRSLRRDQFSKQLSKSRNDSDSEETCTVLKPVIFRAKHLSSRDQSDDVDWTTIEIGFEGADGEEVAHIYQYDYLSDSSIVCNHHEYSAGFTKPDSISHISLVRFIWNPETNGNLLYSTLAKSFGIKIQYQFIHIERAPRRHMLVH